MWRTYERTNQRTIGLVLLTWVLRICWNQWLLRKRSLKILNLSDLNQGQWMTLTFGTHKASCTHLVDCIYQLLYNRLQLFLKKIHCFTFFPYKSIRDQIWPWHKTVQGHPRDIIWSNLAVLEYPKLHTNFHGHQPFGSREDDFLGFYHIWAWRPNWSCDQTFVPPSHGGST